MRSSPLEQLKAWGLSVSEKPGGALALQPKGLLNDDRRDFLRRNRQKILDELKQKTGLKISYVTSDKALRIAISEIQETQSAALGIDIETFGDDIQQHVAECDDGHWRPVSGKAPGARSKQRTITFQGGLDPHMGQIRSIQIATQSEAWVFDLRAVDLNGLREVLESRSFVAFNALFEHQFLLKLGLDICLSDAMLMDRVVHGVVKEDMPYRNLAQVAERELGITLDKSLQADGWGSGGCLTEEQIKYAAMDAVVAARLYPILKSQLERTNQWEAYVRLERTLPIVADMMLSGIGFDVEGCTSLIEEWQGNLDAARRVLNEDSELASLNLASSKQKELWLKSRLSEEEIRRWPKTPKGGLQTGADVLLTWEHCPEGLVDYLKAESLLKQLKTFLGRVHPLTGRIHAQFLLAGASSGRYLCRNPNLQNPPSEKREPRFRKLFIASRGNILVGADFSQIELRIAAAIAPEPSLQRVFQSGDDLHCQTASKVLGIPLDEIGPKSKERSLAKALNFGLLYGMGPERFRDYAKKHYDQELTLYEARQYREAFFKAYPGLAQYHQRVSRQLGSDPVVKTRGGLWVDSKRSWTNALNAPIQGTGAEILNEAIIRISPHLERLGARLIHLVHDEILLEVPQENSAQALELIEKAMVDAFESMLPDQNLTRGLVDPSSGPNWGDLKAA